MAEENTTVSSGAMSNDTAPTGAMPTTSAASEMQDATTSPDAVQKELADLRAALKKSNEDAKTHRLKAAELDKLKAEIEASKLSETERLQKQYDDLKAQHDEAVQAQTERAVKHEVALEAAKLGVDPNVLDKVARFLDWEEIDVDEQGQPTNIRALVEQLVRDIPGLRSKGAPTSGGATNPPRSTTTAPQALSWDVIGKMKPDEYNARRSEIQQWIAEHPHRYGSRLK